MAHLYALIPPSHRCRRLRGAGRASEAPRTPEPSTTAGSLESYSTIWKPKSHFPSPSETGVEEETH